MKKLYDKIKDYIRIKNFERGVKRITISSEAELGKAINKADVINRPRLAARYNTLALETGDDLLKKNIDNVMLDLAKEARELEREGRYESAKYIYNTLDGLFPKKYEMENRLNTIKRKENLITLISEYKDRRTAVRIAEDDVSEEIFDVIAEIEKKGAYKDAEEIAKAARQLSIFKKDDIQEREDYKNNLFWLTCANQAKEKKKKKEDYQNKLCMLAWSNKDKEKKKKDLISFTGMDLEFAMELIEGIDKEACLDKFRDFMQKKHPDYECKIDSEGILVYADVRQNTTHTDGYIKKVSLTPGEMGAVWSGPDVTKKVYFRGHDDYDIFSRYIAFDGQKIFSELLTIRTGLSRERTRGELRAFEREDVKYKKIEGCSCVTIWMHSACNDKSREIRF